MATADELRTFLEKRGYPTSVTKNESNFLIEVTAKTVGEVAQLLTTINEPGRFIVTLKLADSAPLIASLVGVPELREQIKLMGSLITNLESEMRGNVEKLNKTDDQLKKDSQESIKVVLGKVNEVDSVVKANSDDLKIIKAQPWWKRFLGVK